MRDCSRLVFTALAAAGSLASAGGTPLTTELVESGFSAPLYVTHAPGDTGRIFVVEQGSGGTARIKVVDINTDSLIGTFLTISGLSTGGERGLLGLAFHPSYSDNGFFYVNHTVAGGTTTVARYTVAGDPLTSNIADPASVSPVLSIPQPFSNHNGGWIAFGPDDYLYVATGDGGSSGDPGNRSQNITNQLLGKMLRLDVNGDDFPADPQRNYAIPPTNPFAGITPGDDEIWAYGLRNPWRNAFDSVRGDLYIADVGQGAWEEINYQKWPSAGGNNYGWRCYEGNASFNLAGCSSPIFMDFPVQEYSHGGSPFRCSITGGEVYRGCRIPDLDGTYFYADICSNQIWSFSLQTGDLTNFQERTAELDPAGVLSISSITSFGIDAIGEMYIVDQGGEVFRIIPADGSDGCTPMPCSPADLGEPFEVLDFFDVLAFLDLFDQEDPSADLGEPFGVWDFFDVLAFLAVFDEGCP